MIKARLFNFGHSKLTRYTVLKDSLEVDTKGQGLSFVRNQIA